VEKDFADDERDRPERFTGPEPVLPTRWWHALHHALVFASCLVLHFATRGDPGPTGGGFFHSLPLTLWMLWYGDAYTAVLHCALDRAECLHVSILNGAARGFQAHHEFPYASTRGRGVYRMICDTHRIQVITIASALFVRPLEFNDRAHMPDEAFSVGVRGRRGALLRARRGRDASEMGQGRAKNAVAFNPEAPRRRPPRRAARQELRDRQRVEQRLC
jgi:hypothetical protein